MRKRSIIGIILGAFLVLALLGAGVVYILRFQILQYSAEAVIRKLLPEYIEVDRITFNPQGSKIVLGGFRIINPPEFSNKYLLEVNEIIAGYRMKGKNFLDGIEILEPVFRKPVITIERLGDGSLNLMRMPAFMRDAADRRAAAEEKAAPRRETKTEAEVDKRVQALIGDRTVADMVTMPETFVIKEGKLVFADRQGFRKPYIISIDEIEALMSLKLDKSYTNVLQAGSQGQGVLNGQRAQVVKWNSTYDPTTPRLTMANRFDVSGADIMAVKPYCDAFSPFNFHRGNFSGTLVFDFDNGNIGATAEVRLDNLSFDVKEGAGNSALWDTPADELARYFTGPSGEVIFDFKIKGDMAKPKFFLGPISKQAMTSMAIDKVAPIVIKKIFSQAEDTAQTDLIGAISDLISKKKE